MVFVSLILVLYTYFSLLYSHSNNFGVDVTRLDLNFSLSNLINMIVMIALGHEQGQFWYIPFTMVLFFLAPFLFLVSDKQLKYISICLFSLPIFVGREGFDFYTGGFWCFVSSFCYFSPFFVYGMFFCRYECEVRRWVLFNKYLIICLFIFTTVLLFLNFRCGSLHSFPIMNALWYFQKIFLILILLIFVERLYKHLGLNKYLDILARYSFCIFFLHVCLGIPIITLIFNKLLNYVDKNYLLTMVLLNIIAICFTLLLSVLIGFLGKKIFGKRSRMFLGV